MNLTPDEARESLKAVEQASALSSEAFGARGGAVFLIIWGIVALIGFMGSQFLSSAVGRDGIWIGLLIMANTASAIVSQRHAARVRSRPGARIAFLSMAVFAYTLVGLLIAQPLDWQKTTLLVSLVVMFLYLAIGLWLEVRQLILLGVVGTVVALFGYLFLPGWFGLWMAVALGGGFITLGTWMMVRRG